MHTRQAAEIRQLLRPWEAEGWLWELLAVLLGVGIVVAFLLTAEAQRHGERLLPALGVTVLFAVGAWLLRGVSRSGALAGGVVSFVLYAAAGGGGFLVLLLVFLLTLAATFVGYRRKHERGLAQNIAGRRATQVGANLYPAAVMMVFAAAGSSVAYTVAAMAVLAEVAADTISSELGTAAARRARLITNLAPVPAGTDGGVTLRGTLAGALSAMAVAGAAVAGGVVPFAAAGIIVVAALAGMLLDSLLGATLERRGILTNNLVNLCGTVAAALVALALVAA